MSTRLFIDNLPNSVTESELRQLFTPFGLVTRVSVVTDRHTGGPNGSAYVVMDDDSAAEQAIRHIHGQSLEDRQISVAKARGREPRAGSGSGFRGDGRRAGRGGH